MKRKSAMAMSSEEFEGKGDTYKDAAAAAMRGLALREDIEGTIQGMEANMGAFLHPEGRMGSAWRVALQAASASFCEALGEAMGELLPKGDAGKPAAKASLDDWAKAGMFRAPSKETWRGDDVGRNASAFMAGLAASGAPALDFAAAWIGLECMAPPRGASHWGPHEESVGWAGGSPKAAGDWAQAWMMAKPWLEDHFASRSGGDVDDRFSPKGRAMQAWRMLYGQRWTAIAEQVPKRAAERPAGGSAQKQPRLAVQEYEASMAQLRGWGESAMDLGWLRLDDMVRARSSLGDLLGRALAQMASTSTSPDAPPDWRLSLGFLDGMFALEGPELAGEVGEAFQKHLVQIGSWRRTRVGAASLDKDAEARIRSEVASMIEAAALRAAAPAPGGARHCAPGSAPRV